MLRFFRTLRQRLLTENRFSKYLLYAVGEVLLVVIGILIALQIDNWNEENNGRTRAKAYLEEIRAELLFDLKEWEELISYLDKVDQAGLYLNDFLSNTLDRIDSTKLKDAYLRAGHLSVFSITDIAYNNLISSGEINLIENDSLKRQLGFLHNSDRWDKRYHDGPMQDIYNEYSNYINRHSDPLLVKAFFVLEFQSRSDDRAIKTHSSMDNLTVKWDDVKQDKHYRVLLDQVLANRAIQRGNYLEWKMEILALIENIELELDK